MKTPPIIKTRRLILRLANEKDVEGIVKFLQENDEHFAPWEPIRGEKYYTGDYWRKNILNDWQEFLNGKSVRLFMFEKTLIGVIHFSNIVRGPFQSCLLGYKLGMMYEGKGYMFEALEASIDYMFTELNLHRIEANYIPRNERSKKVLDRLGFRIFGEEDDYLMIAGKWERHIRTSLINREWIKHS